MKRGVILMIRLCVIECLQWNHLRHNWTRKYFCLFKLGDVCIGNALLFVVRIEDHRAILRANVRSLTIEFSWIMGHGEEDLKQLAVRDLGGVEGDLYGLGVPRAPSTHPFIFR